MRSMSMKAEEIFQFGRFQIDARARTVRREKAIVTLNSRSFDVLLYFVQNPGRVLAREEMLKNVWPDAFVDEHSLAQSISVLRRALEEKPGDNDYIVTLPGRGYQFVSPVTVVPPESLSVIPDVAPPSGNASNALLLQRQTIRTSVITEEKEQLSLPIPRRWGSVRLVAAFATAAILLVSVAILGGTWYWRSHRAPKLTEEDTIVLADFDNKTGDIIFDDTLQQALSIQLEQSPFLNVLSDSKVNQTLKLMGRPAGDPLTLEVTREVCQRTGSKAMLIGSIAGLDSQYVIGLKAVNCDTGDMLAETQEQAAGNEAVLKALDNAAGTLRAKLGESLSSVQKYTTPLVEATTPSLEALKAFSLGHKTHFAKGNTAALPFYKRAVELDPNFAMGYAYMGLCYHNLGEAGLAAENLRKAYELREKVSERERLSIEAGYYMYTTRELEKAAQAYELRQQNYPRDYVPYANLGDIYGTLGNWEKELEEAREATRLEPNDELNYLNLGDGYANLNRLDEAEAVYKQAEERKLGIESLLSARYGLAFLEGDTAQMVQLLSAAMGKPGTEDVLLASQADTEAWHGKLKKARALTRRAMDSAQHNDAKEAAAMYQAAAALREVESGNREQARTEANAALKLAPNRNVRSVAALALARAGDTAEAEKLAAELDRTFQIGRAGKLAAELARTF